MSRIIIASVLLVALGGFVQAELNPEQVQDCLKKYIEVSEKMPIHPRLRRSAEIVLGHDPLSWWKPSFEDYRISSDSPPFAYVALDFKAYLDSHLPGSECSDDANVKQELNNIREKPFYHIDRNGNDAKIRALLDYMDLCNRFFNSKEFKEKNTSAPFVEEQRHAMFRFDI